MEFICKFLFCESLPNDNFLEKNIHQRLLVLYNILVWHSKGTPLILNYEFFDDFCFHTSKIHVASVLWISILLKRVIVKIYLTKILIIYMSKHKRRYNSAYYII